MMMSDMEAETCSC